MKKTKILVPAIAVLALGLAASTTATVAWFQSTQTVNSGVTDETGTLSATLTNPNVGNFQFVLDDLTATEADKSVDLTDAQGKSWAYIDETHLIEVNPANPTCEWSGLTWKINYSGPSDTASKIQSEWAQLIANYPTATVAASSKANNTHVVRFGAAGSSAAQCANGPYALASNVALNTISWSSVTVSGPAGTPAVYSAQVVITNKLTAAAFATALTGLTENEHAVAAGTHVIEVGTTLNAA